MRLEGDKLEGDKLVQDVLKVADIRHIGIPTLS